MRSSSGPEMRDWYSPAHLGARAQARSASDRYPHLHSRVAFPLPHVRHVLKYLIPLGYVEDPSTIADHLKKRRITLALNQLQAAKIVGVKAETYRTWEWGQNIPTASMIPLIANFLGYSPDPAPNSFPERMIAKRRELGMSRKAAARFMGIDEGTLQGWEEGTSRPTQSRDLARAFLDLNATPDEPLKPWPKQGRRKRKRRRRGSIGPTIQSEPIHGYNRG
jgi:DNA-binding transcriptional regulator YiaG